MNGAPRRRRRPQPPRREQHAQFPLLPLAIVLVLAGGFAIGAFFSHRRSSDDRVSNTSVTTGKGVIRAQPTPVIEQGPASPETASASPESPTASPLLQTTPAPTTATAAPPTAAPKRPRIAPTVAATLPPPPWAAPVVGKPHPAPLPSSRRETGPAPQTTTVDSPTAPVLSGGPDHVVRAYLNALIRGDERTANTALGRGPDSGNSFPEQDFIDAKSRITSVHTAARSDGGFTVETEVAGAKGLYFVTFQVNKTPDGYVIGDHSYIKP